MTNFGVFKASAVNEAFQPRATNNDTAVIKMNQKTWQKTTITRLPIQQT